MCSSRRAIGGIDSPSDEDEDEDFSSHMMRAFQPEFRRKMICLMVYFFVSGPSSPSLFSGSSLSLSLSARHGVVLCHLKIKSVKVEMI